MNLRLSEREDFPGGPVIKTPFPAAGGMGSIPGWGTKILHARVVWPKS